jgi:hypothetical protein
MAMTGGQGPFVAYGSLSAGGVAGGEQGLGPSMFYLGYGVPDPRFIFDKERAGGFKGIAPALFNAALYRSAVGTPAAHLTTNIAAAHTVASGVAMTLAVPSFGAVANIPISPISATGNGYGGQTIVTPALCLDFGFGLATLVSGSANVTFADTSVLVPGMPLVFAAIATTTTPWMTTVQSITSATVAVMTSTAPFSAATGGARVGTGNIWQPIEGGSAGVPTAAAPYFASGPGLFLDPRQAIARGVVITCNNALGAGGALTVKGYDVYGQAMTETITSVPGTSVTTYGIKAFKYIASVTPAFTDATYTYAVGTSDVFGFATRAAQIENTEVWWNAGMNVAATGFTAGLASGTASTATTADVRGTIQTSAIGGLGGGIGSTASNGSHSGTAFTGVILSMGVRNSLSEMILANAVSATSLMGNAQF